MRYLISLMVCLFLVGEAWAIKCPTKDSLYVHTDELYKLLLGESVKLSGRRYVLKDLDALQPEIKEVLTDKGVRDWLGRFYPKTKDMTEAEVLKYMGPSVGAVKAIPGVKLKFDKPRGQGDTCLVGGEFNIIGIKIRGGKGFVIKDVPLILKK